MSATFAPRNKILQTTKGELKKRLPWDNEKKGAFKVYSEIFIPPVGRW